MALSTALGVAQRLPAHDEVAHMDLADQRIGWCALLHAPQLPTLPVPATLAAMPVVLLGSHLQPCFNPAQPPPVAHAPGLAGQQRGTWNPIAIAGRAAPISYRWPVVSSRCTCWTGSSAPPGQGLAPIAGRPQRSDPAPTLPPSTPCEGSLVKYPSEPGMSRNGEIRNWTPCRPNLEVVDSWVPRSSRFPPSQTCHRCSPPQGGYSQNSKNA